MGKFCVGIDLGGTFIKFVAMDADNKAGELLQLPTPPEGGGEAVAAQMAAGAEQMMASQGLRRDDCAGVGIGAPGPLSRSRGVIIATPNIPGMIDVPMRDMVADRLSLQATLENDANAAAYGEFLCGAGQGAKDMVLLTLGTGVGSGIIIDGRVLHGRHEIGGEIGHMIVDPGGEKCSCGQRGCLERYCSATNLADYAMRLIWDEGRQSSLKAKMEEKAKERKEKAKKMKEKARKMKMKEEAREMRQKAKEEEESPLIDAKDIQEAAFAGDELAAEVWDRSAYYLAVGLVSICRIFDPDKIILAGGMTKAGERLMNPVRKHFGRLQWSLTEPQTEVCIGALGNDAGAIGAAGVAWQDFG